MKRVIVLMMILLLLCGAAPAEGVNVEIPDLSIRQMILPENDALAMVRDMKAGWNLGNTFDAYDCYWLKDPMDYESGWCGVKTTEELIELIHSSGFNTIRIPVSWHNHLSADWTIDPAWLDRVYEVASWAYDRGMYVIINIHHDCAPEYYYPDSAHYENSAKYVRTIWTQVAEKFQDWDEHLIFESINEPRLSKNPQLEWNWNASVPECADAMEQIVKLNQVFVDTIRASGGKNPERYLMVPAYDANPSYACNSAFTLPEDPAENRIIVSAHAYSPFNFALQMPGIDSFSLKNAGQKAGVTGFLADLFRIYVAKGIPVVMGEFGAMEKNGNLQDRVDWLAWYVGNARARGITCCWWDNNIFTGADSERFGLFDREKLTCVNPELLSAFMKYCE